MRQGGKDREGREGGREGPGARGQGQEVRGRGQGSRLPPALPPSLLQWPMKDLVLLPISCHLSSSQLPDAGSG